MPIPRGEGYYFCSPKSELRSDQELRQKLEIGFGEEGCVCETPRR
jgi:hypothetical protein